MPHKNPEARKQYLKRKREELLANPEAYAKYKEWHRNYYANHRRNFLGYQKKYQRRTAKDPRAIAARRRAQKRYYYAKRSKDPAYNKAHTEYAKRFRAKLKARILQEYGAICVCCGETIPEFLTPDHIKGGGRKHLKHRGVQGIYLDIIREGFPKDKYRILCMNCNWGRSVYGVCPHEHRNRK